jgi:hypothetical protein
MFFPDINTKSSKKVLAKIIKEVYLTNNLVIKLLISIDIIVSENINIIISKKSRYIRSYSTNIPVKIS